jgi:hypothetical protein
MWKIGIAVVLYCALTSGAQAKTFANRYVEFPQPIGWDCDYEDSRAAPNRFSCRSTSPQERDDAYLILDARSQKPFKDTLEEMLKQLKAPISFEKSALKEQVIYAKDIDIAGHPWVDSLHFQSERPGFYSRYLWTINSGIRIELAFHISKGIFEKFAPTIQATMVGLRSFRSLYADGGYPILTPGESATEHNLKEDFGDNLVIVRDWTLSPPGRRIKQLLHLSQYF